MRFNHWSGWNFIENSAVLPSMTISRWNPGRVAGLLYLFTIVVGFFAMVYVPEKLIVHGDAAATAGIIAAHELLFRLGIAAQLVSEAVFVFVALALYNLFREQSRTIASSMVLLIVVAVPIAFVNELNAVAALALARGIDSMVVIDKPQRDALTMLFLQMHHFGFVVAEMFSGLWLFPLAWLVYGSRFLPRFLGVWLALAGCAWVVLCLTGILLPQYQNFYTYSQPAVFGEIAFMLWLVVKGARPSAFDKSAL